MATVAIPSYERKERCVLGQVRIPLSIVLQAVIHKTVERRSPYFAHRAGRAYARTLQAAYKVTFCPEEIDGALAKLVQDGILRRGNTYECADCERHPDLSFFDLIYLPS